MRSTGDRAWSAPAGTARRTAPGRRSRSGCSAACRGTRRVRRGPRARCADRRSCSAACRCSSAAPGWAISAPSRDSSATVSSLSSSAPAAQQGGRQRGLAGPGRAREQQPPGPAAPRRRRAAPPTPAGSPPAAAPGRGAACVHSALPGSGSQSSSPPSGATRMRPNARRVQQVAGGPGELDAEQHRVPVAQLAHRLGGVLGAAPAPLELARVQPHTRRRWEEEGGGRRRPGAGEPSRLVTPAASTSGDAGDLDAGVDFEPQAERGAAHARSRTWPAGASGWVCIHDLDQPALEQALAERDQIALDLCLLDPVLARQLGHGGAGRRGRRRAPPASCPPSG